MPELFFAPKEFLRGEASECAADVAFAKALQRAVTELTNTLACYAEHRADFLESVFASCFETEVETEHLCIPRRQSRKCGLYLVIEEAIHCFFFGVRHFVGNEALDERAIAFRIHRCVESHVARVEGGERLNDVDRKSCQL